MFAALITMWMIIITLLIAFLFVALFDFDVVHQKIEEIKAMELPDVAAAMKGQAGQVYAGAKDIITPIYKGAASRGTALMKQVQGQYGRAKQNVVDYFAKPFVLPPATALENIMHLVVCDIQLDVHKDFLRLPYKKPITLLELFSAGGLVVTWENDIDTLMDRFLKNTCKKVFDVDETEVFTHKATFPTLYLLFLTEMSDPTKSTNQQQQTPQELHDMFTLALAQQNDKLFRSKLNTVLQTLYGRVAINAKGQAKEFTTELKNTVVGFKKPKLQQTTPFTFEHVIENLNKEFKEEEEEEEITEHDITFKAVDRTNAMCQTIITQQKVPDVGYFTDPLAFNLIGTIFQNQQETFSIDDIFKWFKSLKTEWFPNMPDIVQ